MKAFVNWSGGKDSSFCLYKAAQSGITIEKIVTTINTAQDRISMHGVRRALLDRQAASLNISLTTIELPENPDMVVYENGLSGMHQALRHQGFTHAVYGDIFLEDLKVYRDGVLAKDGLEGIYPLWKMDSHSLMKEFLAAGFKAIVVCVNAEFLDKSFCGRIIDQSFIDDLPVNVDVCGENGEYHSFVFDGPIFSKPIPYTKGEIIFKEYPAPKNDTSDCFTTPKSTTGFYFCDLLPTHSALLQ
ncbi:MAG: ATP-binding protein [Chitinophagaceae bacterium]